MTLTREIEAVNLIDDEAEKISNVTEIVRMHDNRITTIAMHSMKSAHRLSPHKNRETLSFMKSLPRSPFD